MKPSHPFLISSQTHRRFVLGQQGLFPGRRWRGKAGVADALHSGSVVQIDPLNVVARSHDLALFGRVLDYQPTQLDELLYTDRAAFDYGGTVTVYPMKTLPYVRLLMQRKVNEPRWLEFAQSSAETIAEVYQAVQEAGPLGARDFKASPSTPSRFRSSKDTSRALYYLWLKGDLMTSARRNFDRLYDLRQRIAPAKHDWAAPVEQSETYLIEQIFHEYGVVPKRNWRGLLSGALGRKVSSAEAAHLLENLLEAGKIHPVRVESRPVEAGYILSPDLPLLETLESGQIPSAWQPLETTTEEEAVFLAPLEITTARGRALNLFGFEYVWEVYKPQEHRRWGYYTLPILVGDRLVGRLDPRVNRSEGSLEILGFWLESGIPLDSPLETALAAGFRRFTQFLGVEKLEASGLLPESLLRRI